MASDPRPEGDTADPPDAEPEPRNPVPKDMPADPPLEPRPMPQVEETP
jgi:hypothetical protein